MRNLTLLGIDLAKNVFQLHGTDTAGNAVLQKKIKRTKLLGFLAQLPACRIVMEACSGANYWSRRFQELGHEVQLISPQFVKPFVKTNKNDQNDAQAITEAASRPSMRFVLPKSIEQQDVQNLHRIRSRLIKQRTALGNQIRGLLAEYGVVVAKSLAALKRQLVEVLEDAENELTSLTREVVQELQEEFNALNKRINDYDRRITQAFQANDRCQQIATVPGIGEITATALIAAIGDAKQFKNGRQLSAWLGLVPQQYSSGGKERLLGISKRGDSYLRRLLIHGARAVLTHVDKKTDHRSTLWAAKKKILGANKAVVALANKNARVIWALLQGRDTYNANQHVQLV